MSHEVLPIEWRRKIKANALDYANRGFLVRTVSFDDNGQLKKYPDEKWNREDYPNPTTVDDIEYSMNSNRPGLWLRIPVGWVVVDHDNQESIDYWTERLGADTIAKAAVSKPPNSLPHWWFRVPATAPHNYCWSAPPESPVRFDLRSQDRGGVMAPPSMHHKGGTREWVVGLDDTVELTEAEAELLAKHQMPGAAVAAGEGGQVRNYPRDKPGTAFGVARYNKFVEVVTEAQENRGNGKFNTLLNREAFMLGQWIGGGELSEAWATGQAAVVFHNLGVELEQIKTFESGLRRGIENPKFKAPDPWDFFQGEDLLPVKLAKELLKAGPLAIGPGDGVTWKYVNGVWRPSKNEIRDRSITLLDDMYKRSHLGTIEDVVRSMSPTIGTEPQEAMINFRNGMLDWRTGELLPHDSSHLSTVQMHTEYDPTATCPEFDKFLGEVLQPDMVDFVWELIGYLMYSGNPLHKAVMLTGTGRNGKGTWLRVVKTLLGPENLSSVTLQELNNDRFASADLFGKIANIAGDIDSSYSAEMATFKAVTGGDLVRAQFKNRDAFSFTPWAVPVFSANKVPMSGDVSVGFLSRWVIVPFPNSFQGKEDRDLDVRLSTPEELRGIAARATAALRLLMERGNFPQTDSATEAVSDFRKNIDQVARWFDDTAEIDEDAPPITNRAWAYTAYKIWAKDSGYRPVKSHEFYSRLRTMGVSESKVNGVVRLKGMRITEGLMAQWRSQHVTDSHQGGQ